MYGLNFFLFTSCRSVYWCVRDDWQSCLVRVNSLITHLQLKKMSVIYQSSHVAIFQLLEISSITTPNQLIFEYSHKVQVFQGKISAILPICIMKKIKSGSSVFRFEHSSILLTFIKVPFVIKFFVLSSFEWPFYTGFTVTNFRFPVNLVVWSILQYFWPTLSDNLSWKQIFSLFENCRFT